jgi:hypothetical protein
MAAAAKRRSTTNSCHARGGSTTIDDVEAIFIDVLAHAESGGIQSCSWTRSVLLLEAAAFEAG